MFKKLCLCWSTNPCPLTYQQLFLEFQEKMSGEVRERGPSSCVDVGQRSCLGIRQRFP